MPAPSDFAYQLKIVAEEPTQPMLDELALFLFHIDAIYDLSRLTVEPRLAKLHPDFPDFWFPPYPRRLYFPGEYPLSRAERLQVRTISKRSPLEVVSIVAAAVTGTGAAFWAFVQAIKKISNWKLNKQKLEADVRKAREDAAKAHAERAKAQAETRRELEDQWRILTDNEIEQALNERPANRALDSHLNGLEHLPFKPTEIEIQIVRIRLKKNACQSM